MVKRKVAGESLALPMISIITPCLNRVGFVEAAIESVLDQDYPKLEHIVVDGGSTDGTLDVLRRYEHVRLISEPDEGVYDALNKGIAMARGEIIGHLNTDDLYEPHVLSEVARCFVENPDADMVCGGATVFEEDAEGGTAVVAKYSERRDIALSVRNMTLGVPLSNARFVRKRFYDRVGVYDTRYRLAADRDFFLRAILAGASAVYLDRPVYRYCSHVGSLTIGTRGHQRLDMVQEYLTLAEQYLNGAETDKDLRRYCRRWHGRETAFAALVELSRLRVGSAGRYIRRGWRHDLGWPLHLFTVLFTWLAHRSRGAIHRN